MRLSVFLSKLCGYTDSRSFCVFFSVLVCLSFIEDRSLNMRFSTL